MSKEQKDFQNKLLKEREAKERLIHDIETMKKEQENTINFIKEETGKEYEDLEKKFSEEVDMLKNTTIKLKNNSLSHVKKFNKHNQAIEALKENHNEKLRTQNTLNDNVYKLKLENKTLEAKLKEKNAKITLKEKNIYELKRRTQELEKYKFVLDFKIKDLKRDIVPRETEIKNLKLQTTLKDKKLKRYNALNNKLGLVVENLQEE